MSTEINFLAGMFVFRVLVPVLVTLYMGALLSEWDARRAR